MTEPLAPHNLAAFERLAAMTRGLPGGGLLRSPSRNLPAAGGAWIGHRDYCPGDDVRQIDWRLAARTDELLTRVYRGDSDDCVYLLVDESRSMSLGRPSKREAARLVAAGLAYLAAADLQRVEVVTFADGILDSSPAIRRRLEFGRIAGFFSAGKNEWCGPRARTEFKKTAEGFVRRRQQPGVVVWISDLFDPDGLGPAVDLLRDHGYCQRVLHLVDPDDAQTPCLGELEWSDVESGRGGPMVVTEAVRDAYAVAFADYLHRVKGCLAKREIPYARLFTPLAQRGDEILLAAIGVGSAETLTYEHVRT